MLVLNIAASLLAFYSFIKFLDDVVMWFGRFAGEDDLSFSYILGYILYPVAFLIGIDPQVEKQKSNAFRWNRCNLSIYTNKFIFNAVSILLLTNN